MKYLLECYFEGCRTGLDIRYWKWTCNRYG